MLAPLSLFLALLSVASVSVSAAPLPFSHSSTYLSASPLAPSPSPFPTGLSDSIPNHGVRSPNARQEPSRVPDRWLWVDDVEVLPTVTVTVAVSNPTTTNFVRGLKKRQMEAREERRYLNGWSGDEEEERVL